MGLGPHPSVQIAASVSSDEPRVTLKPLFHSGSLRKNMKHIKYVIECSVSCGCFDFNFNFNCHVDKLLDLLNCLVDRFVV